MSRAPDQRNSGYITGSDGLERFGPTPAGETVTLHAMYVLDGKLEARVGDETTTLTPGSFIVMPSGVPHTWRNAAEEPSRFVCLFSPGGHAGVLKELSDLEASEDDPGPEAFEPILNEYDIEMVGPPVYE